jgi:hypothetical protein
VSGGGAAGDSFKRSLTVRKWSRHLQEDLLIHGDSVYDVVDKQDHMVIQNQLARSGPATPDDRRLFLCRINVSRNSRRQLRFGDQKVRTCVRCPGTPRGHAIPICYGGVGPCHSFFVHLLGSAPTRPFCHCAGLWDCAVGH